MPNSFWASKHLVALHEHNFFGCITKIVLHLLMKLIFYEKCIRSNNQDLVTSFRLDWTLLQSLIKLYFSFYFNPLIPDNEGPLNMQFYKVKVIVILCENEIVKVHKQRPNLKTTKLAKVSNCHPATLVMSTIGVPTYLWVEVLYIC